LSAPRLDFILNEDYLILQIIAKGQDSSIIQKLRKQVKKYESYLKKLNAKTIIKL
jgi:hypothetical protein